MDLKNVKKMGVKLPKTQTFKNIGKTKTQKGQKGRFLAAQSFGHCGLPLFSSNRTDPEKP